MNSNIPWLPDTGADLDAMSMTDLARLDHNLIRNLQRDTDEVFAAGGQDLGRLGKLKATLHLNGRRCNTQIHVYRKLQVSLLSRESCINLGLLEPDWPQSKMIGKLSVRKHTDIEVSSVQKEPSMKSGNQSRDTEAVKQELLDLMASACEGAELKTMSGPPMHIELEEGAVPCKRYKAYTIPYHWREKVKAQLDSLEREGVIERVPVGEPITWCHPMVVVPKKGKDEPRITVDLTGLNKYVKRPVYPARVPRELVARIPKGMRYFTSLDSRHGYYQVELDEQSKELVTFLTEWGPYRFRRNVMGLISGGDEHNRRGDEILDGFDNVIKVVEDILIYDKDYKEHVKRVRKIIETCVDNGITLNGEKFVFAVHDISYCGFRINSEGYTVNADLVKALSSFPKPENKTDVRYTAVVDSYSSSKDFRRRFQS